MKTPLNPILCLVLAVAFLGTSIPVAQSGEIVVPPMPKPGSLVTASPAFKPVQLKGIIVSPQQPYGFDVVVNSGDTGLTGAAVKSQALELVKYFMAALAVPEQDLWVNLSPYEKDRVISPGLQTTALGKGMLAQDYLLKQLTASLSNPNSSLGAGFWKKIYQDMREQYPGSNMPTVNTGMINKVWIVPDMAKVYERAQGAVIVEARLKVLMEEDYLALGIHQRSGALKQKSNTISYSAVSRAMQELLIPALQKEVNEGQQFASLRQIYQAVVLASWYKIRLRESALGKTYVDRARTTGIAVSDNFKDKIYQQYLEAFKKGAYNFIKEEMDPGTNAMVARKYVSGGASMDRVMALVQQGLVNDLSESDRGKIETGANTLVGISLKSDQPELDPAMTVQEIGENFGLLEQAKEQLFRERERFQSLKIESRELVLLRGLNASEKQKVILYRKSGMNILSNASLNRQFKVDVRQAQDAKGSLELVIVPINDAVIDADVLLRMEAHASIMVAFSKWLQGAVSGTPGEVERAVIERLREGGNDTLMIVFDALSMYMEGLIERQDFFEDRKQGQNDSSRTMDALLEQFILSNATLSNGQLPPWKKALRGQIARLLLILEEIFPQAKVMPIRTDEEPQKTVERDIEEIIVQAKQIQHVLMTKDIEYLPTEEMQGLVLYYASGFNQEVNVPNNIVAIAQDVLAKTAGGEEFRVVTAQSNDDFGRHVVAAIVPLDKENTGNQEELKALNLRLRVTLAQKIAVDRSRAFVISRYFLSPAIGEMEAVIRDLYDYLDMDLNLEQEKKRNWDKRVRTTTEFFGRIWGGLRVELINYFHEEIKADPKAFSRYPYMLLENIVDRTLELMKYKGLADKGSPYAHVFFYPEHESVIKQFAASEISRQDAISQFAKIYEQKSSEIDELIRKAEAEKHAQDLLAYTESVFPKAAADIVPSFRPQENKTSNPAPDPAMSANVYGGIDLASVIEKVRMNLSVNDGVVDLPDVGQQLHDEAGSLTPVIMRISEVHSILPLLGSPAR